MIDYLFIMFQISVEYNFKLEKECTDVEMDDSMDPAIIQIWNDYSKLMSDNNTLKDAVLGLLRAIMYLESHPGFPGDVVSTLWGIVKLLNYSDQGDQDIDTDKDALVEAVGDSSVQWTSFVNEATTGQVGVKSGKQAIKRYVNN